MAVNQVATLGVKVDPRGAVQGAGKAKRAITGIGKTANNVKKRVLSLQGALLGLGAGAVLKSVINTASAVESLKVRLKFLTGSTEDASKAFEVMTKFASAVPFALEEIERASPLLLTVADDVDELNELLSITGDIAAVSGLSFEATAGQLQRAMAGGIASADLFRERGVKAFLGFEEGVQFTAEQTTKHIKKIFREGTTTAKGATEELKDTYQGQVSMMADAFRELKLVIADNGVFELTANTVKKLTEVLRDPKTIENMKKLGEGITQVGSRLADAVAWYNTLPTFIKQMGLVFAVFGGIKGNIAIGLLISQAETLTAVLKSVGLVDHSPKDLIAGMEHLSSQIKEIKKAIPEESWWRKALFGNLVASEGMLIEYEEELEKLEKLYAEIPVAIKEAYQQSLLDNKIEQQNIKHLRNEVEITPIIRTNAVETVRAIDTTSQSLDFLTKKVGIYKDAIFIMTQGQTKATDGMSHLTHGAKDFVEVVTNSWTPMDAMSKNFDKIQEQARIAKERIKEFADGLATNIEDSIVRMVQGLMTFKDVVKSVFAFVAQEMIKMNIAQPMAKALSSIISGGFGGSVTGNPHLNSGGGGFGDFLKGLFKADGGSVTAGQPYIVGERGPELFSPSSSGMITPNNQMGGQTINVTYSPQVNALDPRTAQSVIAENAPTIVAAVRQAFNQNGQAVAI